LRWLKRIADALGGLLFLTLFITFLFQITARFFFNKPLAWTDELAVILYIWVILWASAFIVSEREHVMFDLIWNWGSLGLRRVMRIAGNLLLGGLALAAIPGSWDYVHFMAREGTPVLGISFQWVFMPFVLLLIAIVVRSAINIWDSIQGRGLEEQGLPS
jgi:TRAP-type C4-dicarboxylate transport system permease small subunit